MNINAVSGASRWADAAASTPSRKAEQTQKASTPQQSTNVTLSADGKVAAFLAERGVSMTFEKLGHGLKDAKPDAVEPEKGEEEDEPKFVPIDRSKLEKLLGDMGVSSTDVKTLVEGFDRDGDGKSTHDENLKALGQTYFSTDGDFAQTVMRNMDSLGTEDGKVSQLDFAWFQTRLMEAGKPEPKDGTKNA